MTGRCPQWCKRVTKWTWDAILSYQGRICTALSGIGIMWSSLGTFPQVGWTLECQVENEENIYLEDPSTTVFMMPGLEVLDYSTPTHIILNNVISDTSGVFKCEVSAGPPRFSTASRTTHLQIVGMCATSTQNIESNFHFQTCQHPALISMVYTLLMK